MTNLQTLTFDLAQCRVGLNELDDLLARNATLAESRQILPFFRQRPHLSALLGSYDPHLRRYDRVAFELRLFGDFIVDLVVGDVARQAFCFIEFEGAKMNSVFRTGARRTLEWSPYFDHGSSQIIDWFWKLQDQRRTETFERLFGSSSIHASGLLVIGRDSGVTAADRLRLERRRENVMVNSQRLYCCTFDELARDSRAFLDNFTAASNLT